VGWEDGGAGLALLLLWQTHTHFDARQMGRGRVGRGVGLLREVAGFPLISMRWLARPVCVVWKLGVGGLVVGSWVRWGERPNQDSTGEKKTRRQKSSTVFSSADRLAPTPPNER
jgi:hypothetical protein